MEAPHFGEGAVRLAGSALRKSLLPEVFSTPPFPSSPGREREGSFGPVCPRNFSLFPSRTPRLGVGGGQVRGRECGQEVPKSSVLSKWLTQKEEMRQVEARPLKVWSHHPTATKVSGHPRLRTESLTPAPELPEWCWVRGPQTLPWAG